MGCCASAPNDNGSNSDHLEDDVSSRSQRSKKKGVAPRSRGRTEVYASEDTTEKKESSRRLKSPTDEGHHSSQLDAAHRESINNDDENDIIFKQPPPGGPELEVHEAAARISIIDASLEEQDVLWQCFVQLQLLLDDRAHEIPAVLQCPEKPPAVSILSREKQVEIWGEDFDAPEVPPKPDDDDSLTSKKKTRRPPASDSDDSDTPSTALSMDEINVPVAAATVEDGDLLKKTPSSSKRRAFGNMNDGSTSSSSSSTTSSSRSSASSCLGRPRQQHFGGGGGGGLRSQTLRWLEREELRDAVSNVKKKKKNKRSSRGTTMLNDKMKAVLLGQHNNAVAAPPAASCTPSSRRKTTSRKRAAPGGAHRQQPTKIRTSSSLSSNSSFGSSSSSSSRTTVSSTGHENCATIEVEHEKKTSWHSKPMVNKNVEKEVDPWAALIGLDDEEVDETESSSSSSNTSSGSSNDFAAVAAKGNVDDPTEHNNNKAGVIRSILTAANGHAGTKPSRARSESHRISSLSVTQATRPNNGVTNPSLIINEYQQGYLQQPTNRSELAEYLAAERQRRREGRRRVQPAGGGDNHVVHKASNNGSSALRRAERIRTAVLLAQRHQEQKVEYEKQQLAAKAALAAATTTGLEPSGPEVSSLLKPQPSFLLIAAAAAGANDEIDGLGATAEGDVVLLRQRSSAVGQEDFLVEDDDRNAATSLPRRRRPFSEFTRDSLALKMKRRQARALVVRQRKALRSGQPITSSKKGQGGLVSALSLLSLPPAARAGEKNEVLSSTAPTNENNNGTTDYVNDEATFVLKRRASSEWPEETDVNGANLFSSSAGRQTTSTFRKALGASRNLILKQRQMLKAAHGDDEDDTTSQNADTTSSDDDDDEDEEMMW